jgi:hypothetical protein
MSQAHTLLTAQTADYQALLEDTRALLAGSLEAEAIQAFRARRDARVAAIAARTPDLMAALADGAPAEAVAAYRAVLEALVAAERALAERAAAERDGLGAELARMAAGRRALAGYHPPRTSEPVRAVSHRV